MTNIFKQLKNKIFKTKTDNYTVKGNNKIIITDKHGNPTNLKKLKNLEITFKGDNNLIKISNTTKFDYKTHIICSDNNYIEIGKNCVLGLTITNFSKNSKLIIGNNVYTVQTSIMMHDEKNLCVKIGNDCIFSSNITIRPSDGHTIYDASTGEILNYPKDIDIQEHCWIGEGVIILKGSVIEPNTIIGAKSLVNKRLTQNSIYAGIPARLIKNNVSWDGANTDNYQNKIKMERANA